MTNYYLVLDLGIGTNLQSMSPRGHLFELTKANVRTEFRMQKNEMRLESNRQGGLEFLSTYSCFNPLDPRGKSLSRPL